MNSVLTTLEQRTTTEAAQAPVNDHVKGVHRITGQYLFDRFVGDHDGDTTRMDIVRYAIANIDTDSFKKALKDAVEIASKHSEAAKKTMQNHQTVMRLAYGAWKFAAPQLNQLGADDKTGYQAMRVLGKQALEKAGRKWDGSKAEKVDKTAAAIDEASAMRLAELKRDNPIGADESATAYEMRMRTMLAQEMASEDGLAEVLARREVSVLAEKFRKLCETDSVMWNVIRAICLDPANAEIAAANLSEVLSDPSCQFDITVG